MEIIDYRLFLWKKKILVKFSQLFTEKCQMKNSLKATIYKKKLRLRGGFHFNSTHKSNQIYYCITTGNPTYFTCTGEKIPKWTKVGCAWQSSFSMFYKIQIQEQISNSTLRWRSTIHLVPQLFNKLADNLLYTIYLGWFWTPCHNCFLILAQTKYI